MKISIATIGGALLAAASVRAFSTTTSFGIHRHSTTVAFSAAASTTMADAGVPPATEDVEVSSTVADIEIPTNLPSDVGKDYVPLATMLATGDLADADQVCVI